MMQNKKTAVVNANVFDGIEMLGQKNVVFQNGKIISVSDEVVEIPQVGTKHSLNVSVAAGIVLWDFFYKTEI